MPKRKGAEAPSHPSMPSPRIIAIANNKGGSAKRQPRSTSPVPL
jgi:hypothetical protein